MPTNYGPNPTPVTPAAPASTTTLLQFIDVPDEDITLQTTWVELPICTGAKGEYPLFFHLENAIHATCKSLDPWKAPEKLVYEKEQAAAKAKAKAIIDAANAKAAEEIDGQAAQDS